ncbi:EscI/YscI/HrpB family type III secretion system inner rod protein [Bradyrhizobium sp. CB3481]|uniref:EscI/YscI/HrpB family type III secretion system inner rod protein n=1 Tax=Bradyrhizobium sp. CB3481 TaxID=3039158 RepID=UPI0024B0A922|nr:EscI/YscI/HrpB family type III secretion system inner rod protein [Bradyrhizobium sp. CB3481]WFU14892.1 EscI/YscI/HrpB family type III secretion system inner rod protein [Bradyrhizobium sp. CB3481]
MSGVNSILPMSAILVTETSAVSKVSSDSVEAFRVAFERPILSPGVDEPPAIAGGELTEELRGAGHARISDGILSEMEKLSVAFNDSMRVVSMAAQHASSGEIRSAEWLNAQLALSAVTLQYDIATKVVGKAAQTIDTFLKSQ